ncbi:FG-GAP repeat domain-containing protein [Aestuariibaculum suncheonense]|uniref:VCBS repeat-containing protein n=1 Tax=Aestuariibaculum suncheonense TaxID=1028745 RepID=A0A8J6QSY9_9FLAO|nr:VCBS repeat-containing protein [Aestuariibaculum suncheonense]MBD0835299.1 VCBS repeat-containing protein [Aestuariibaculum suncheonense]
MKKILAYVLPLVMLTALLFFTLTSYSKIKTVPVNKIENTEQLSGRELAKRYCTMCHLFPEPSLLDKTTWAEKVLPNMGLRLGVKDPKTDPYKDLDPKEIQIIKSLNIFPNNQIILDDDWQKIIKYYKTEAPSKLPVAKNNTPVDNNLMPFEAQYITVGENKMPMVTMLEFNKKTSELYIGDFNNLYAVKNTGELTGHWKLNSPATHAEFRDNKSPLVLGIGNFAPSDQENGMLASLYPSQDDNDNIFIQNLKRPVYFVSGDLNNDRKKDVVVCNFGNYTGKLSWYDGFNSKKEHVLSYLPGARVAYIKDMNKDGKPDVIALMAQAFERVSIFYNQGNNIFEEEKVVEFPPVYGVSYLELVDMNKDGYNDLIISNGDNWDLSPIEKPYHGFRIYLNDGKNHFKESYFYPLSGCSKVMTGDFDGDDDLDIVAISFYSQLDKPNESFVYLQNDGKMNFTASYLPQAKDGKWLTMEIADFNNDKKDDVLLGSFIYNIAEMGKAATAAGHTKFSQVLLLTQKK